MQTHHQFRTPTSRRSMMPKQILFTTISNSAKIDCKMHKGNYAPSMHLYSQKLDGYPIQNKSEINLSNNTVSVLTDRHNPESTPIGLKARVSMYEREILKVGQKQRILTCKKMQQKYPQTPRSHKKQVWERQSYSSAMKRKSKYITVVSRMPINKKLLSQSLY